MSNASLARGWGLLGLSLLILHALSLVEGPALSLVEGAAPSPVEGSAQGKQKKTRIRNWNLPHDRAAHYHQFDGYSGSPMRPFWLLGCELDGRVGATDTRQLPYRFIFRRLPKNAQPGTTPTPPRRTTSNGVKQHTAAITEPQEPVQRSFVFPSIFFTMSLPSL